METVKSYTNLEQSKKLAEILPLESADMRYTPFGDTHPWVWEGELKLLENGAIPCWSLAALLDNNSQVKLDSIKQYNKKLWRCCAYFASNWHNSDWYDNLIDACVKMIVELKEKKS